MRKLFCRIPPGIVLWEANKSLQICARKSRGAVVLPRFWPVVTVVCRFPQHKIYDRKTNKIEMPSAVELAT